MNKADIKKLVEEGGLTITDVIDVVIEINGFIGVGLITLSEQLSSYVESKIKPISSDDWN